MNTDEKQYFAHETAVIDNGAIVGNGSKIWHFSHISGSSVIGSRVNIGQNCFIAPNVIIGNNVKIQNNVSVYEGVILEDYVFLGPSMVFTNVRTPRSEYPRNTSADYKRTLVKRGASIGANATIISPVTIGRCAFVGAGATVTRDIPDFAIVYGNPAKIQGYMCACGDVTVRREAKLLKCDRCKTCVELN